VSAPDVTSARLVHIAVVLETVAAELIPAHRLADRQALAGVLLRAAEEARRRASGQGQPPRRAAREVTP
jgi:hypothetical protein